MSVVTLDSVRALVHDGVDTAALRAAVWRRRWRLVTLALATAAAAGVFGAFLPRWYRSGASLTVDSGQTLPIGGAGMLGIAAQLGLSGAGAAASPQFYADLLASRTLRDRLLVVPVLASGERTTLLALWGRGAAGDIRAWSRAREKLAKHFAATANARTGVIEFSLEAPSASAAKLLADSAVAVLNQMVISIRRQRASAERRFLEARWMALRDSLAGHELALRSFYERNRLALSPQLQYEETRLRREVDRVQGVYAQLGTQLEQARIQEVRDTPAIALIDAPLEPARKSSPKLSVLVLAGFILGVAVSLVLTLFEAAAPGAGAVAARPDSVRTPRPLRAAAGGD